MKKVIILGSLNMDLSIQCDNLPKNGETCNGYGFIMNPGGKGGNQAVASSKLGASTHLIANVGNDSYGNIIKKSLNNCGVLTSYVLNKKMNSGIAMIIRNDKNNRIILENGANHSITKQQIKFALNKIGNKGDIFLTQLENNLEAVEFGLCLAKQLGLYTIFNPAPAIPMIKTIYQAVDLLVMNESECKILSNIDPTDLNSCKQALKYFNQYHCDCIITLGEKGSIALIQGNLYKINALKVEVIDTTGAGDSYIGAICASIAKEKSLEEAIEFATVVSAIAVGKIGAQSSIPYFDEVNEFLDKKKNVENGK